jgi:hypothetical protein
MAGIEQLRLIVSAAKAGRVSPRRALAWAQRAARGEDITVLASLAPAAEPLGEPDASRLTNAVAAILASDGTGQVEEYAALYALPTDTTEGADEYQALYVPPAADADRSRPAASAPAYTEEDVYALLFGGH